MTSPICRAIAPAIDSLFELFSLGVIEFFFFFFFFCFVTVETTQVSYIVNDYKHAFNKP